MQQLEIDAPETPAASAAAAGPDQAILEEDLSLINPHEMKVGRVMRHAVRYAAARVELTIVQRYHDDKSDAVREAARKVLAEMGDLRWEIIRALDDTAP